MSRLSKSGLGVDLVEYKKAKKFYARHQNRLRSYFASTEVSLIQKSAKPYESLAMLLASKEAIFKFSDQPWMGPEGFRKIQILSRKNQKLSFRLHGNFKKSFARRPLPSLYLTKSKDFVVAECR